MFPRTLYTAALVATVAAASDALRCANSDPTEKHIEKTNALMQSLGESSTSSNGALLRNSTTVTTYFHVVHANETTEGGYLTSQVLQDQLDVLNDQYGPHGFTFDLSDVIYHDDPDWASNAGDGDGWDGHKADTRQGGYDALNVWFSPDLGPGVGGWCTFPEEDATDADISVDGCAVLSGSVPDGATENYDLGMITVHEVGHWMNLYHTFQGGCDEPGDRVDDTPAQESATVGCPAGRDSCPGQDGEDPIHNHMDYSYDACKEEFTDGQRERMQAQWDQWRTSS